MYSSNRFRYLSPPCPTTTTTTTTIDSDITRLFAPLEQADPHPRLLRPMLNHPANLWRWSKMFYTKNYCSPISVLWQSDRLLTIPSLSLGIGPENHRLVAHRAKSHNGHCKGPRSNSCCWVHSNQAPRTLDRNASYRRIVWWLSWTVKVVGAPVGAASLFVQGLKWVHSSAWQIARHRRCLPTGKIVKFFSFHRWLSPGSWRPAPPSRRPFCRRHKASHWEQDMKTYKATSENTWKKHKASHWEQDMKTILSLHLKSTPV